MDTNRIEKLRKEWEAEERIARIHGWDFSHLRGRWEEKEDLPWDYGSVVREFLTDGMKLLDYDTGGGEFLLSLGHPPENTSATEGYPPNVTLCRETLPPLEIDFRECADPARIPFGDGSFEVILNRHGSFDPAETRRLLRPGGLFITEQVGSENDRDLVAMVLPDVPPPFPDMRLSIQEKRFADAGFELLRSGEAFRPIRFFDVGAFVWFARVIEWEFPGFSVERCFDRLLAMQDAVDTRGFAEGTIHRYLIVAQRRD